MAAGVWLLVARWLRQTGATGRVMAWIGLLGLPGLLAGVALVVYGSFLGTEGPVYRWLRQDGTVGYFGFTCLNLRVAGCAVQQLAQRGRLHLPRMLESVMLALGTSLVLLGIVNAIGAAAIGEPLKGRMENVTAWWGGLIFVLGFCAIAALWRRERVVLRLGAR